MRKFNTKAYLDSSMIMSVVLSLIILAGGVFVFFATIQQIPTSNDSSLKQAFNNTFGLGNSVFNVIGIVLIISVIMMIVGMVYNYVGGDYEPKPKKKVKKVKPLNDLKQIEKERKGLEKSRLKYEKKTFGKKKDGWQI